MKRKSPAVPGRGNQQETTNGSITRNGIYLQEVPEGKFDGKNLTKNPYHVLQYLFWHSRWPHYVITTYIALLSHRNSRTLQCNPQMERLAEEMGVAKKVVISSLKALEGAGAIIVEKGMRTGKTRAANNYRMVAPWDVPRVPVYIPLNLKGPHGTKEEEHSKVPTGPNLGSPRDLTLGPHGTWNRRSEQEKSTGELSPRSSEEKVSDSNIIPFSSKRKETSAKDIAKHFNSLLNERFGEEFGGPKEWKSAVAQFSQVLRGGPGQAQIPADELLQVLDWVFDTPEQLRNLRGAYGIRTLRFAWDKWKNGSPSRRQVVGAPVGAESGVDPEAGW